MLTRDEITIAQKELQKAGLLYGQYQAGVWDRTTHMAYSSFVQRQPGNFPVTTPFGVESLHPALRDLVKKGSSGKRQPLAEPAAVVETKPTTTETQPQTTTPASTDTSSAEQTNDANPAKEDKSDKQHSGKKGK